MNRSLRRRHWWWMVFLAITLPVVLLAFLGARDFSRHDSVLPSEVTRQQQSPERP